MELTKRQRDIMDFVIEFKLRHRISPTLAEIAERMDVSRVTIHEHLKALKEKGVIETKKHSARSIKVLAPYFRTGNVYFTGGLEAGQKQEGSHQSPCALASCPFIDRIFEITGIN